MAIIRKSPSELEKMRKSGLLVYQILSELSKMVKEGITTMDLDCLLYTSPSPRD